VPAVTSDQGADAPEIDGRCLCGATRLRVRGPFPRAILCHCSQCRRATGSAFNVAVPVAAEAVTWIAADRIVEVESAPGKVRAHCGGCGAQLFSRYAENPGILRLRGGILDDFAPAEVHHIFWNDRAGWFDRTADAPRWKRYPPDS
jgi:hypothetical protein